MFGSVSSDDISSTLVSKVGFDNQLTLRVVYKAAVVENKQQEAVMRELDLLKSMSKTASFASCPCLPALKATYSDKANLYVLYENKLCCSVGEIMDSLGDDHTLDEAAVKHVAMCVISGLEVLHQAGVVYRGISPDTLLVSTDGMVTLANFQHSRQNPDGNLTICGSPEYLAPEVVVQQGHGISADYWTLGVLLYELFANETPFHASNEIDIYAKICRHKAGGLTGNLPADATIRTAGKGGAIAWIEKLLEPDPELRVGSLANAGGNVRKGAAGWISGKNWKTFSSATFEEEAAKQLLQKVEAGNAVKTIAYKGNGRWCEGW